MKKKPKELSEISEEEQEVKIVTNKYWEKELTHSKKEIQIADKNVKKMQPCYLHGKMVKIKMNFHFVPIIETIMRQVT